MGPIDVIKQLMRAGYMLAINDVIEFETASLIARSFGFPVEELETEEEAPGSIVITPGDEEAEHLEIRPPVVTILGHVDHGKTTLLDAIRKTNVVDGESGGITQHIGAYQVSHEDNVVTFLDTPGHEAFTEMRARGARVTDVAVLVVAADDGVMPQTVEAIDHVKAADVPIIVAINKVDRPNSDPERIKRQLSEHDLIVEDWGGDVISVPVSALRKEGIDDLLANILVVSEVAELKANPNREAKGVVVEARLDKSRGPVATVLVQTGTLEVGNIVVAGGARGRVKAMLDDSGGRIRESGPSTPVEILGLDGLPPAGQSFEVAPDEKTARAMVSDWEDDRARSNRVSGVTLEDVHAKIESGEMKALDLIVKTDVQGSIDAIRSALEGLRTDDTRVNLIHIATGSITESDVMLASASNAVIVGFRSEPQPGARMFAIQEGVDVRYYGVIYNLIDEIEMALAGLLAPVVEDIVEGYATVRALFQLGRGVRAAGIFVNEGQITRRAEIHVTRSGRKIFTGQIGSLKHFRDDVRELTAGNEGGIVLEGFRDFQEGDVLESHVTRQAE
jgi:translation initiation factor IF-2